MGIVNVTPDSFSDGGRFLEPDAAVAHGLQLAREGADVLDIGGESTRPGAQPVDADEERRRVLPVIRELARRTRVPLSIDTSKAAVAADAIQAGACIINDIGAMHPDPAMNAVLRQTGAGYVLMHMQGSPSTMQDHPSYQDVVGEVRECLRNGLHRLRTAGVDPLQVAVDVGIGFGKNLEHNLELLARLPAFTELGRPLLLGVSRKSFISRILEAPVERRLPGALAASCLALAAGAQIVRTHDVAETLQALRVTEAILARRTGTRGTENPLIA